MKDTFATVTAEPRNTNTIRRDDSSIFHLSHRCATHSEPPSKNMNTQNNPVVYRLFKIFNEKIGMYRYSIRRIGSIWSQQTLKIFTYQSDLFYYKPNIETSLLFNSDRGIEY